MQIARALMTDPELLCSTSRPPGSTWARREDLVRRLGRTGRGPGLPRRWCSSPTTSRRSRRASRHALLLRDGAVVAQGKVADVLTPQHLSTTFGLPLAVHDEAGRYYARAL